MPDLGNNPVFKDSNVFDQKPFRHENSKRAGGLLKYVAENGKTSRYPAGEFSYTFHIVP